MMFICYPSFQGIALSLPGVDESKVTIFEDPSSSSGGDVTASKKKKKKKEDMEKEARSKSTSSSPVEGDKHKEESPGHSADAKKVVLPPISPSSSSNQLSQLKKKPSANESELSSLPPTNKTTSAPLATGSQGSSKKKINSNEPVRVRYEPKDQKDDECILM